MPSVFRASIVPRPNVAFDSSGPCISSPASSRTDVQLQTRARLSSHGFNAATPPTGRPCDQSHTRASSCPWRSLVVSTRSSVLSVTLTAHAADFIHQELANVFTLVVHDPRACEHRVPAPTGLAIAVDRDGEAVRRLH